MLGFRKSVLAGEDTKRHSGRDAVRTPVGQLLVTEVRKEVRTQTPGGLLVTEGQN